MGWTVTTRSDVFDSANGTAVLRLIAFAYTYHYLNWFLKTSLIGWHTASRQRLVLLAAVWLAAVGIGVTRELSDSVRAANRLAGGPSR